MKLTITRPAEVEAAAIRVNVPIAYGVEDIPEDAPGRRKWREGDTNDARLTSKKDDRWDVVIDIDTGVIRDWPAVGGNTEVSMKVVDCGVYDLLGPGDAVLARIVEDYAPDCHPFGGDYVDCVIDPAGRVMLWRPDPADLSASFFPPVPE